MEFRAEANRTKIFRSRSGRRTQIGSLPRSATKLEDVPEGLLKKLEDGELRELTAWLRGSEHRVARESAFAVFDAVLDMLKRSEHLHEVDKKEMCRAAWMILERFGDEIDQSSLKNTPVG